MDSGFWHERWARDEIGFHRREVHPFLARHWRRIAADSAAPVLVPLCGKSVDLSWLAGQGHEVVGIELSRKAAEDYFGERDESARESMYAGMPALSFGGVTLCIGDFFEFRPSSRFSQFYDRASLIALPPSMRSDYRKALVNMLTENACGLLVTLDYPQHQMDGPPFSVGLEELRRSSRLDCEVLEERDALPDHPGFRERGLAALVERALRVRPAAA